jgi:hypothetical protein
MQSVQEYKCAVSRIDENAQAGRDIKVCALMILELTSQHRPSPCSFGSWFMEPIAILRRFGSAVLCQRRFCGLTRDAIPAFLPRVCRPAIGNLAA